MKQTKHTQASDAGFLRFDPIVLVMDVAKKWLVILLVALIAGVSMYIYTDNSYSPTYTTSTTFVVTARGSAATVYSNLSSTTYVASVFSELLTSSLMEKTVMESLNVDTLDSVITTALVPNTNLINMSVTASDPRTAFMVASTIIQEHETLTYQIVDGVVMEVLRYPSVPSMPSNYADAPGQMKKMMFLGALAACVVLAVLSIRREAVRSSREARERLDCDFLGEIPHERRYKTLSAWIRRRKAYMLVTEPLTGFRFVEAVRKLRHRVEGYMDGGKVLMVTSLLEDEGKSTVSVNLALSMAQKHHRVLLIDCDLRKPACHTLLGQRKVPAGIREVLNGQKEMEKAVIRYRNTRLDMLLTQQGDGVSADLLVSHQMEQLLEQARNAYDFVVLDLPPMAVASDAESMTELADASLLVVRQNAAVAPAINRAIEALENGKCKLLGCVLNNVYTTRLFSGMGYGYSYGYGYGHRYGKYGGYGYGTVENAGGQEEKE